MNKFLVTFFLLLTLQLLLAKVHELNGQGRAPKVIAQQPSLFKFGIIAGPVLSQLDGDGYTGYDKLGIYSGIKGEAVISKDLIFEVDLAFSMLGAKIPQESPNNRIVSNKRIIYMNFTEVPLLINYRLPYRKYPLNLEFGVGIKQLVFYKVIEDEFSAKVRSFAALDSKLNKRNYAGIVGIERFYKDFTIGFRATFALNYQFYNQEYFDNLTLRKPTDSLVPLLRSYYISLVGSYTIFGTKF